MQFDATKVMEAVKKIVEESPDVIYTKSELDQFCSYTRGTCTNGAEGCLIGQAIISVYPEAREELSVFDNSVSKLDFYNDQDGTVINWLKGVQNFQDLGYVWKDAVGVANNNFGK